MFNSFQSIYSGHFCIVTENSAPTFTSKGPSIVTESDAMISILQLESTTKGVALLEVIVTDDFIPWL